MTTIDPSKDGIDHINIYSRGETELGRFLTNVHVMPLRLKEGVFSSIESYWFWLLTGNDKLKLLNPYEARDIGKSSVRTNSHLYIDSNGMYNKRFQRKIMRAIKRKIDSSPEHKEMLIESTLPFKHYYVYGDKWRPGKSKIYDMIEFEWIINFIDFYRNYLNTYK